jgi:hypothetical protein
LAASPAPACSTPARHTSATTGGELNVFDRFAGCEIATTLDNGTGVGNEEGTPVRVCRNPRAPWSQLWPDFRHID